MKKKELLPNIITAFALSCGLFLIFRANMIGLGEVNESVLTLMAGIFLIACVADLMDGAVARAIKAESEFGGLFDSLSDAVTFGVAPSVIVLKTMSLAPGSSLSFLLATAAMVYSVCGVLRLVRFNVMGAKSVGNQQMIDESKKNFTGLPIPAAAAAVIASNLFLASDEFKEYFLITPQTQAWILFSILILLGYLMVSRWKFPAQKNLHIRVRSFRLVFPVVVCASLIFYGILHYFPLLLFSLSWAYVIIGWSLSIIRSIAGKRTKTLEDFEPEPDDLDEGDEANL